MMGANNLYHVCCFVSTGDIEGYSDCLLELENPEQEGWLDDLRVRLSQQIALKNSLTFFDPKYIAILSISKL